MGADGCCVNADRSDRQNISISLSMLLLKIRLEKVKTEESPHVVERKDMGS